MVEAASSAAARDRIGADRSRRCLRASRFLQFSGGGIGGLVPGLGRDLIVDLGGGCGPDLPSLGFPC